MSASRWVKAERGSTSSAESNPDSAFAAYLNDASRLCCALVGPSAI